MATITKGGLNDYADSMFRFEQLHTRWIESSARYLRYIFGDAIKGKIFLDYGFGRGNWSLAALRAGAAKAVAIDAAAGNVKRFSDYCREHDIHDVDIIHGNVLNDSIHQRADILWVYGILPCIAEPDDFIDRVFALRRDNSAVALLYAFDEGSLRQVIVEAARAGVTYDDEESFDKDSYLFTPRARLRARDDLTAPVVRWYTAAGLARLASGHGAVVRRQLPDFHDWTNETASEEFRAHHQLCDFRNTPGKKVVDPERPQAGDFAVLAAIAETLMAHAAPAQRRALAIGLFNTHFSALRSNGAADEAVADDFLFLMHAALRLDVTAGAFNALASAYYTAAIAATRDGPRNLSRAHLEMSPLARFLELNTLRF